MAKQKKQPKNSKAKISPGDSVVIETKSGPIEGILMPSHEFSSKGIAVIKRPDGYNMGISTSGVKIKKIRSFSPSHKEVQKIPNDPNKPTISILHTGGTIASRVDYKTGAVIASFSPEELIEMYPELNNLANIKSRLISNLFSEDMRFEHYQKMAKAAQEEISHGVDGIIITHGTDTMHYSSAALAFMLRNLPIPVILVGAQRSSDRGSSDAFLNMVSAARFITETDFSGVAICMHENLDDESCLILPPCRSRKMHSSARDAFKSIDTKPIARIGSKIDFLSNYQKRDKSRKLLLMDKIEERVALVKIHPNISPALIDSLKYFRGLILEGTGLGHAPEGHGNEKFFNSMKKISKNAVIGMTTQTIYGKVNMNVYSTGRDYQKMGVIPCPMLPETAFIKLAWILGNYPKADREEITKMLKEDLCGEIFKN